MRERRSQVPGTILAQDGPQLTLAAVTCRATSPFPSAQIYTLRESLSLSDAGRVSQGNEEISVVFCPHRKCSSQAAVSGGDKTASWILPGLLSKMIREHIKSLAETSLPADFTMQAMKFIAEAK